MSNYNSRNGAGGNFVDISSNVQVKKLYTKKGRVKRIVCILLSILLLIGGSGMVYYYSVLNSMNFKSIGDDNKGNVNSIDASVAPLEGDVSNLSLNEGSLLEDPKILNIMLFGEDNSKSEDGNGLSDSMIMLSIDNRHKKLKLTSFQRDTYVYIPGYGYNKMNAAYTFGGAKLAIQTIEANFGVSVDRYAVVDFDSFKKIIDTLGGIDMEVTQDEIDYINYQMYKNGQVSEYTTIKDAPGIVHLDGQEALWYARNRGLDKGEDGNEIGLEGDDWARTSRQRKLLETVFNSLKNADIGQIISIVGEVGPLVTTNIKKDEITALVAHSLTYLSYSVEQYKVPGDGLWFYDDKTNINGRITSTIKFKDLKTQRLKFAEFIFEDLITGNNTTTTSAH